VFGSLEKKSEEDFGNNYVVVAKVIMQERPEYIMERKLKLLYMHLAEIIGRQLCESTAKKHPSLAQISIFILGNRKMKK